MDHAVLLCLAKKGKLLLISHPTFIQSYPKFNQSENLINWKMSISPLIGQNAKEVNACMCPPVGGLHR